MTRIIKADEVRTHDFRCFMAEEAVALPDLLEEENPYEFSADNPQASAEQKAIAIVEKAMMKAREIERQAFERGYHSGEAAARENIQRLGAEISARFGDTLARLSDLEERICKQAEHNVVELSIRIARKIVDREVTIQPEIIVELVRQCVMRVSGSPFIRVRVNPGDYARVYEQKTSLPINLERMKSFSVEADPAIDQGGCIVETSSGSIDARIGKQFSELYKAMLGGPT